MTSHELAGLVGAYALDALDEPERESFEAHLADCADCTAEVTGLRAAAAELSLTTSTPPPAALRGELLAAIGRVRPLPPRAQPRLPIRQPRRWLWPAVAAACALLAVISAGWGLAEHRQLTGHRISPLTLSGVLDSRDVATASVAVGGSGHATLIYSKSKQRLVFIGQDLPAPPAGKTYQLWMLAPDGTATSGGLFRPDRTGTVLLAASGDLGHTAQMGISIEPAGGAAKPTPGAIVADIAI
jgi:anti-sigma-K factor RskA